MRVISLRLLRWGGFFEVMVRERNVLGYCCGSEFNAGVVFREFIAGVVMEWVDCECCGVSSILALSCSELFWGVVACCNVVIVSDFLTIQIKNQDQQGCQDTCAHWCRSISKRCSIMRPIQAHFACLNLAWNLLP